MTITFHSEARKEFFEAAEYYDEQVVGLGGDFVDEVEKVIYLIPFHNPWQSMVDGAHGFSDDYMEERNQQEMQVRDDIE